MSEIIKTEAVVLSKLNYGDTSCIASLYTKEYGKLSAIIKGGRSPKSKMGLLVDPLNHLQLIIYNKESRELQLISSADLVTHFSRIKNDFDKLKYAYAILELVKKCTVEHEANEKIFRGIIRILELIDASKEPDEVLFGRFFLFFLKETGIEPQFEKCAGCGKTTLENMELSYNNELGILCNNCRKDYIASYSISAELFRYLLCLKANKTTNHVSKETMDRAVIFMEKFLMYHFSEFKGIQAFQLFK